MFHHLKRVLWKSSTAQRVYGILVLLVVLVVIIIYLVLLHCEVTKRAVQAKGQAGGQANDYWHGVHGLNICRPDGWPRE